jgi:hypothetical protein
VLLAGDGRIRTVQGVHVDGDDARNALNRRNHFAEVHRLSERARFERERLPQLPFDRPQHLFGKRVGLDPDCRRDAEEPWLI